MGKNSKKRDHYLPKFYLNFFLPETAPKFFWVYDKNSTPPRKGTLDDTGIEKFLYRVHGGRIENPKFIDDELLEPNESKTAPVLRKLFSSSARLENTDIPVLAEFLALMHIRVPRTQQWFRQVGGIAAASYFRRDATMNPDEIEEKLKRLRVEHGADNIPASPAEYRELLDKYDIELTKQPALALSVLATQEIVTQLLEMNWSLCRAPKDAFFITSDAPVVIFIPDTDGTAGFGQGLAESAVEVTFPLSPSKCLYLCRRNIQRYRPMNKNAVRELNRRTAYNAERFLISSLQTEEIAQLISESAITLNQPKINKKELLTLYDKKH